MPFDPIPALSTAELITTFEILEVRPPQPLEHSPIEVVFLLNRSKNATAGWVEYKGAPDNSRPATRSVAGPLGSNVKGSVFGLAPAAGAAMVIELDYHQRDGSEFPPVERTASLEIKVEASYQLSLDWFEVGNPRTGPDRVSYTDLVLGSCSAKLGDQPLARPQTSKDSPEEGVSAEPFVKNFGRHGAKDVVPTTFQFGPFAWVPDQTGDLGLSYVFANIEYEGSDAQKARKGLDIIAQLGAGAAEAAQPTADWSILLGGITKLHELWTATCDGVVAARKIVLPAAVMDRLTSDVGDYAAIYHDPGQQSNDRCGANSNYYVRLSLNRLSRLGGSKVVFGPFGGPGGAPFEEREWPDSTIVGGTIRAGARVDAIQLTFSNQTSVQHGGSGGDSYPFTLDPGERIWGISGRSGARLDSIALHTSKGRVIGPFGGSGGEPFEVGDPSLEMVGIFGRSAREMDAFGAILKPADGSKMTR